MKRIVCFLLALIMVMGLIPNTVVTANAASKLNTSEDARKILEGSLQASFLVKESGNRVGYLTPTNDPDFTEAKNYKDGITKEQALDLMNSYITKVIDKKINDFTKEMNLTLTKGQHDALAVHAYRSGSFASLESAVRNGKKGNEMVNAFVDAWAVTVSNATALNATQKAAMNVALAEAAMYLNGTYGYNGGDKLSYVLLDTDGDMKADDVAGFVVANGYTLPNAGSNSLGWYLYDSTNKTTTGSAITKVTAKEKMVVAKQQDGGNNMPAEYTLKTNTLADLNVYSYGSTPVKTGTILKNSTDFKVTQEYLDANGIKWVYGSGTASNGKSVSGWVKTGKVAVGSEAAAKPIASATVTASELSVYRGATTASGEITAEKLYKNDNVKVYETKMEATNTGNIRWGKIKLSDGTFGWINLALTSVDETAGESGSVVGKTGKIANTDKVNVRDGAGLSANWITSLTAGTKVTVLELKDGWGRLKWTGATKEGYTQGWVYMDYVQMDSAFAGASGGSTSAGTIKYTGVVTSNINLNVRKYADIYATKVDSLPYGTKVNVYETTTSRNMKWGRIGENRWICLTYVNLTEVAQPEGGASGSATSTSVQATVKLATLDIHKNYNSNSQKVGSLVKGDVVTILERNTENTSTGTRIWGRIKVGEVEGWINLAYAEVKTVTTVTGGTETNTGASSNANGADATISNCISVNVRKAAGVYNAQITKLNNGTFVKVYERVTKDNAPWARITWNGGANEGWVCMNYVTMNTQNGGTAADGTVGGTNSNTISATGIVNSNIDLKVRSGAGLGNAQIGALKKGTKVTVYEQVSADGMIWGRTPYGAGSGWICMSYVTVESTTSTGKGVMGTVARCFAAVNVRSAPGTNNALINKINVGSRVEVFETKQHGTQLWGRVAQGWVCMDYILLDSELPPGTILDATVPTTEATQPGATEGEEDVIIEGAVKYSFTVTPGDDKKIYNEADDESTEVGSVSGTVKIQGIKMNGKELWGLIDQYGTAGWLNLTKATYSISGYVNTDNQAIYADNYSTVKGSLDINKYLTITKVSTDGSKVYGWVEEAIFGWIPMDKLSNEAVTNIVKTYRSGETAGTGTYITGKTYAAMNATEEIGGEKVLFKVESGVTVNISALRFTGGKVWGLVEATEGNAWIDLGNVNYAVSLNITSELEVRTSKDDTTKATDEQNNIKGTLVVGSASFCQLQYDVKGNVWAVVTGYTTNPELDSHYVMIRTSEGTNLLGGLTIG